MTGRSRITKIHLATSAVRSNKIVVACGHAIHEQFTRSSSCEVTCEMCLQIEKRGNNRNDLSPVIKIFVGDIWRSRDEIRDVQVMEVFSALGVPRTVKVKTIRAPLGEGKMYSWKSTLFDGNRYRLVGRVQVDTKVVFTKIAETNHIYS